MINEVKIRNFKKFGSLDFRMDDRVVIAGPNNSGKTTLLQAIAAWSEIASMWCNIPDMSRGKNRNYPSIDINLLRFYSVPLANFIYLWKNRETKKTASVWLHTSRWKIGFEVLYKETELATVRPAKEVSEEDLDKYIKEKPVIVYIPPLSGLDTEEPFFDPSVIHEYLARAQAGRVLRNILVEVSRDQEKWTELEKIVRDFFGFELTKPSAGAELLSHYRHSAEGKYLDLSNAASGFLQVLLVYGIILAKKPSVVLIDEPDAHLHIQLQEKMYRQLQKYAHENKSQLIISTHSQSLIEAASPKHIRVLREDGSEAVADIKNRDALIDSMRFLDNFDMVMANQETETGILYVEGKTDINILCEWAKILNHPLHAFLEKPFWKPAVFETLDKGKGIKAEKHFEALKTVRKNIKGVELHDSDCKTRTAKKLDSGLKLIFWKRYEIESYLIHPDPVARFAENAGGKEAARKARNYLKNNLPPVVFKDPNGEHEYLRAIKGKNILFKALRAAGIPEPDDCSPIAAQMRKKEIHPEVVEKLDEIADCLGIRNR